MYIITVWMVHMNSPLLFSLQHFLVTLVVSNIILMFSEAIPYDFNSPKFIEACFQVQLLSSLVNVHMYLKRICIVQLLDVGLYRFSKS